MEGQVPHNYYNNGTATVFDDHRRSPATPSPLTATPPLPPPPGRARHDMYIVQFPKDQVYRVPPRENALIVERYRNAPPAVKKRSRGGCFSCCSCPRLLLTILIIFVAIIAIVGITITTLFFIFNPTGPTFSITQLAVKNPPPGGPKNSPPRYEISLRAKNTNERLGIVYENSEVSMLSEKTKVATGKLPRLEQDRGASTVIKVALTGTNGELPKKMAKSMDDEKSRVAFDLEMRVPVRINVAGLKTWVMKSDVICKFEVSDLGNNTRILSQDCDANFKQY